MRPSGSGWWDWRNARMRTDDGPGVSHGSEGAQKAHVRLQTGLRAGPKVLGREEGYAQLWNALIARGVIAHLPGPVLKVYLSLLCAARNTRLTCWPGLPTLARWSGTPRSRVSQATTVLERHGLLVKEWIQLKAKPHRLYRLTSPTDSMFPDLRDSCAVCPHDVRSSVIRDAKTGRVLGKRPVHGPASPIIGTPAAPIIGNPPCLPTIGTQKQTEADEEIGSRREGLQTDGARQVQGPARGVPRS